MDRANLQPQVPYLPACSGNSLAEFWANFETRWGGWEGWQTGSQLASFVLMLAALCPTARRCVVRPAPPPAGGASST